MTDASETPAGFTTVAPPSDRNEPERIDPAQMQSAHVSEHEAMHEEDLEIEAAGDEHDPETGGVATGKKKKDKEKKKKDKEKKSEEKEKKSDEVPAVLSDGESQNVAKKKKNKDDDKEKKADEKEKEADETTALLVDLEAQPLAKKKKNKDDDIKTHMANERTFFKWLFFGFHLGAMGTFILTFFGQSTPGRTWMVLFIWVLSFFFIYYGLFRYFMRRRALRQGLRSPEDWDDPYGPVMMSGALFLIVISIVAFAIITDSVPKKGGWKGH